MIIHIISYYFKAISVGDEKPNTDVFFNPFIIQLKRIELGIDVEIDNKLINAKFFLIAGVFDKPAKSAVLNMISSTGFYGCTKCLQPGISHKALDSHGEQTGGTQHLYPFDQENCAGPMRTDENYSEDLKLVKKPSDPVKGIKGQCCLSSLKYFKPISSTCIDYMHSLLEGVIKKFFEFWFDSKHSGGQFSLRRMQQEIEKRLSVISPPKFIPATIQDQFTLIIYGVHMNT